MIIRSSPVPAWLNGAADLTWLTPVTNTIQDVLDPLATTTNNGNSGPSSIFDAWNGFSFGRRIVSLANGGHTDYYGNEVYSVDMTVNSPAWVRDRDATASSGSGSLQTWPDGRPVSSHNYTLQQMAEERHFLCGQGSTNYSGSASDQWFEFDFGVGDWDSLGSLASISGNVGNSCAAYDPADRNLIHVTGNNTNPSVSFVGLDTLAVDSTAGGAINDSSYMSCAVDTTNHYLVCFTSSDGIYVMDLDDTASGWSSFAEPSGGPSNPDQAKWWWHVASGAFLTWVGGNTLYRFTPNGGYTDGTFGTTALSGTVGSVAATGIFGRVGLVSYGGRFVLLVCPDYSGTTDVYALPIPAGGV